MNLLASARRLLFGYDAADSKSRRRTSSPLLRSEDQELTPAQRRTLVTSARDVARNFSIAAWATRKHLDYISTFAFQARTGDPGLDDELEAMTAEASEAAASDRARRHPLRRMIRMAEARRTLDGDVLLVKMDDGSLQAVEGDRLRAPSDKRPSGADPAAWQHGVLTGEAGEALAYYVADRTQSGYDLTNVRALPAANVFHHAYWDRFDQTRGVSPMAPAINTFKDVYECFDYALAKARVAQLFGLFFYREQGAEPMGSVTGNESDGYTVDFKEGPAVVNLDPGDRAEFLESKTPSTEFAAFTQAMVVVGLKCLDIPYSFYDESHANFSGSRQAWIQYEQTATQKRQDNRDLLNGIQRWRVTRWIRDRQLILPARYTLRNLGWDWISLGVPWIDPLKEVTADLAAVNGYLASRQEICKSQGRDWWTVVAQLAEEEAELKRRQLGAYDPTITARAEQLAAATVADEESQAKAGRRKAA